MYIRMFDNKEVELPQELNLQERIAFCEKIIEEHPESFEYMMPKNNKDPNTFGTQVSMRLELLGTYILNAAEKDKDCPIMSEYKEKKIIKNEINMSFLEKN